MSKFNKIESFDLEKLVSSFRSKELKSANVFYHTGDDHACHVDLNVRMADREQRSYRLYLPSGGPVFKMAPGQNIVFRQS